MPIAFLIYHLFLEKIAEVIAPEEEHLRTELSNVKNENEIAEKRVQELKQDVYRQKCVLQDLEEMKSDTIKRRDLLNEENKEILKKIRRCEAKVLFIGELFYTLYQKSVRTDCEGKEQRNELLEQSMYIKLLSQMDGKREFQVKEIKKIIFVNQKRHDCKIGIDIILTRDGPELKHHALQKF